MPISINNLITPIRAAVLTRLIAVAGAGAVGGFGVAMRVQAFMLTPIFALQSVIGVFIGQNAGADRWDRVARGAKKGEAFGFFWGFPLVL